MDDFVKLFAIFAGMGLAGATVYGLIAFIGVAVRRMEGRPSASAEELRGELDDLQARVAAGDALQQRVGELEERLDFAERMLAQAAEAPRLPRGQ